MLTWPSWWMKSESSRSATDRVSTGGGLAVPPVEPPPGVVETWIGFVSAGVLRSEQPASATAHNARKANRILLSAARREGPTVHDEAACRRRQADGEAYDSQGNARARARRMYSNKNGGGRCVDAFVTLPDKCYTHHVISDVTVPHLSNTRVISPFFACPPGEDAHIRTFRLTDYNFAAVVSAVGSLPP